LQFGRELRLASHAKVAHRSLGGGGLNGILRSLQHCAGELRMSSHYVHAKVSSQTLSDDRPSSAVT